MFLQFIDVIRSVINSFWGIIGWIDVTFFQFSQIDSRASVCEKRLLSKPEWYHDYSCMGIKTNIIRVGGYIQSQKDKAAIIFSYIDDVVNLYKNNRRGLEGIEMFCADGFYSNYAVQHGVEKMTGWDLEEESGEGKKRLSVLKQAEIVTKLLGYEDRIGYKKKNVFEIDEKFDFCICVGGLYHVEQPQVLLEKLNKYVRYLILQTVVSHESEDEEYFVSPASGWTWGCRFSHAWIENCLEQNGWKIIKSTRNILRANRRTCDRGSSYFLCENMTFGEWTE